MDRLLLIGGGGHCLVVIDALRREKFEMMGIVDAALRLRSTVSGIEVVGSDDDLERLRTVYEKAFISIGNNHKRREEIFSRLEELDFELIPVIHPTAYVSGSAQIGRGVFIGPGVLVNSGTVVEEMCILNSGCIIEHQCKIAPFSHIAPGAALCGNVTIGKSGHIGATSVVKQGVRIGRNVIIGMGSVVTRNIPDGVMAYGNPCRIIRSL